MLHQHVRVLEHPWWPFSEVWIPIDAEVLFDWSDPPVPPGWQGVTGSGAPENGPTTAVVIRR